MTKVFNSVMVVAMLLWAVGGVLAIPASTHAASAGDLIKMAGNPAVYYLGSDDKRYVFPTEGTFKTWYADFSGVVTISDSEMYSYTIGGNVAYRPGTRMIKITTDPKVYALEAGGVLRHVPSEAVAEDLYGASWNTLIDDMPDAFFAATYSYGDALVDMYPTGTLAKEAGSAVVYYIDGTEKRPIADETAFNANNWSWDNLRTHDLSAYTDGSSITSGESDITTVAGPEVSTPSTSTGTLTVALAADTPASATLVQNSQLVKFTKVNFTASGGDAIIDSLKVTRKGLSQDSNFSDMILLDSALNQVGNEKTLTSNHNVTFNDDITVSAGTTKSYYLAANMHSTLQAGEEAALELTEVNLVGSATLSGTLPIVGNYMTMNSTITIGTVTAAAGGSNPSAATKEVGTTDYIFSSVKLTINSTENVQVERFRFYQNGTAADADVGNLDLVVDGTVLATVASVSNKEIIFDLSASPYSIGKGSNKEFSLRGDILDGSSRTISFDFEKETDVRVKGMTYGYYINPSYDNSSSPYFNGPDTTISTGSLTVSKATLDTLNLSEGSTQVELGAFYFQAQGEEIQVTALPVHIDIAPGGSAVYTDVTNLTLYDEDGDILGGPLDPGAWNGTTDGTATITDTIIFPTGMNKYIFKADLSSDFDAGDTIQLQIDNPGDITAKGVTTNNTVTPTPSSAVTGDTCTVKVGSLKYAAGAEPAAQTIVSGIQDMWFATIVLDASESGEDVKVTQIKLDQTSTSAKLSHITGIEIKDGDTVLNDLDQCTSCSTGTTATVTVDIIYGTGSSGALVVEKGTQKTLKVYADLSGSASSSNTHKFGFSASSFVATGVDSGDSITASTDASDDFDGNNMYVTGAGDLTLALAASNPAADFLIAGKGKQTVGVFEATALYEDVEITELAFEFTDKNTGNATTTARTVYLVDWNGTEWSYTVPSNIAYADGNSPVATITPSGDGLVIPKGETKTLTIKVDPPTVGTSGQVGESGGGFTLKIDEAGMVSRKGIDSGSTSVTFNDSLTFKQFNVFKSMPTAVEKVSVSSTLPASGTDVDLGAFYVTADSYGDIGLYKATFALTTNTASVTSLKLYEYDGTSVSGTAVDLTADGGRTVDETITASSSGNSGVHNLNLLFDTDSTDGDNVATGGEYRLISAGNSKTYLLTGTVTTGDNPTSRSVTVKLLGDNGYTNSADIPLNYYPASEIDDLAHDQFIWSDLYWGNNTTTATKTHEWTNGYIIFATTTLNNLAP